MSLKKRYKLEISNYRMFVFLGNNKEEQLAKQAVDMSIAISFNDQPPACNDDLLQNTVCYEGLVLKIENAIQNQRFNLIEHLTQTIFDIVKREVQDSGLISVEVKKYNPLERLAYASFKIEE